MRNHTGTHLLHRALRNVVGERARQAGSLVTPDGLRFDFPFDRALTDEEQRAIEDEVRRIIREDRPVTIAFMSMAEAIEAAAPTPSSTRSTARRSGPIRVQDYCFELCGGTHCRASGQIGGFLITAERSIGSGTRRIEAVTGAGADALVRTRFDALERAAEAAGAQSVDAVPERIGALQDELREAKKRLRAGGGAGLADPGPAGRRRGRARARRPAGGARGAVRIDGGPQGRGRGASASVLGSGSSRSGSTPTSRSSSSRSRDDLVERGISAGDLVRAAMPAIDGRGGGRAEMAQGSGHRRDGLPAAMDAVRAAVQATV